MLHGRYFTKISSSGMYTEDSCNFLVRGVDDKLSATTMVAAAGNLILAELISRSLKINPR